MESIFRHLSVFPLFVIFAVTVARIKIYPLWMTADARICLMGSTTVAEFACKGIHNFIPPVIADRRQFAEEKPHYRRFFHEL